MRAGLRLLNTQAFRIVLVYAVLFSLSVGALLFFTYWNTRRTLDAQTNQIIASEITGLREEYQRQGFQGLVESVISRSQPAGPGIYILSNAVHRIVAGNLDVWPALVADPDKFVEFQYVRLVNGIPLTLRARGKIFRVSDTFGEYDLLVAEDVHDRDVTEHMFTSILPWTMGLILVLTLIGGALMSRNMLRKLDTINRISGEIIAGHLARRIPLTGSHDEFDTLAENLNRMLDRIERLMKGMREVTDSVAHDLRTPLNRLRNRLEESLSRLAADGKNAGEIERAIAETDQLIGTFNALLLIAETDAGTARGALSPLDLTSVASDVCELYEPLAEENTISLTLVPSDAVMIEGNRSLISQALANLVDNAIKYTPAGGRVTICSSSVSGGVELIVADTGPGIPPHERGRVTKRFVRLEASRHSPGTGLGLSLVAAVAHFHGAQLLLEDNAPGLKVTMRFPRLVSRAPVPAPMAPPKSAAA